MQVSMLSLRVVTPALVIGKRDASDLLLRHGHTQNGVEGKSEIFDIEVT